MKEFAAFVFLIVLIVVGWNQPYKAHFGGVVGKPPPVPEAQTGAAAPSGIAPVAAPAAPAATPARDNSWLWKKGTLDRQEKEEGKRAR